MPSHNLERVRYVRAQERLALPPRDPHPVPVRIQVLHKECEYCGVDLLENESPTMCCGSGKFVLPDEYFPHIPDELLPILHSAAGRRVLRRLNALFCMASVGVTGRLDNVDTHPATLKLMGGFYHCILPRDRDSSPMTWVIYDSAERVQVGQQREIPIQFITTVRDLLYRINPFTLRLRALGEIGNVHDASLVLKFPPRASTEEVAAVYDYTAQTSSQGRDITFFWKDDNVMHFISALHPAYMPLAYPLLYPFGDLGYDPTKKKDYSLKPMSMLRFYRQLHLRNPIFRLAGRLSQQHLLDVWTSIDDDTLEFIRKTVNTRIARRRELDETIQAEGGYRPGKVYLPASFNRGLRHRMQLIDDGMAIVSRFGKPTYFITLTCNPLWPEIREVLIGNTLPEEDPMAVCRVFHSKLQKIMKFIKARFGPVVYYMYVIEFQKRGLPHAHIALCSQRVPREAHEIDEMISATVPPERGSRLYELVKQNMIHTCKVGLCLDKPVSEGGICKKGFPKEQTTLTHLDEKGFPVYKRVTREDQYVVPHNPDLLCYVDSHVNVELASYVNVIRYLYKYLYKENDTTPFTVGSDNQCNDEIAEYKKGRYVSASEAAWRLLGFHVQCREPAVQMVPIHLPGQDNVLFYEGLEQAALDNAVSKLDRYFGRPFHERFNGLTYTQYYEQYNVSTRRPRDVGETWVDQPHNGPSFYVWAKRVTTTIVRIQHLLPTSGDIWYLRVLLRQVPARSATDYLTVYDPDSNHGVAHCSTFQEAAVARGLVQGDMEGLLTFEETLASGRNYPKGLRTLFVTMVFHGFNMKPVLDRYHAEMSFDLIGTSNQNGSLFNRLLMDLDDRLNTLGKSMADFNLPVPQNTTTELQREASMFPADEQQSLYSELFSMSTPEQKQITSYVLGKIEQQQPLLLFLQAPAGHGKSHVFKTIAAGCRAGRRLASTMATTGLASLNFKGGRTLHSTFRMAVVDDPSEQPINCDISATSPRADYLREVAIFMLDEAIMGHRAWFDAMDRALRDICQIDRPFADKVVVFAGDFRQLPTIVKGGSNADVYGASIAGYAHWKDFEIRQLTVPIRDTQDPEWSSMIKAIGDDALPRDADNMVVLPLLSGTTDTSQCLNEIYPDQVLFDPQEASKRAILSGTNVVVDEINDLLLKRLPGEERTYYSYDENASAEHTTAYNPLNNIEVLNSIKDPSIPPHMLTLRVGAVCFLERNISAHDGLMHNCKVQVVGFLNRTVEVKVLTGPAVGTLTLIPTIIFEYTMPRTGIKIQRRQIPLRLAYTMTYNKSQGQTLDKVVLDLRNPPFAHGQLYVGGSRVRGRIYAQALLSSIQYLEPQVRSFNVVNPFFMNILRSIETN